jgi:hypothetical protein
MHDAGHIFVVCAAFNYENGEVGVSFRKAACNDAACCAAWGKDISLVSWRERRIETEEWVDMYLRQ